MLEYSNKDCIKKQSRINPGDLCQSCYAIVKVNDDDDEDPFENIDLNKLIGQTNLPDIVDITQAIMTPVIKKIDKLEESIKENYTNFYKKIALLEANNKEKNVKIANTS